ncbi:MAG: nucleotidyltransferase family protein [Alphaproteobacteria bacterium]|nr:nucleotidyltransferase family protein [Alphaproteobacteria bacterium]
MDTMTADRDLFRLMCRLVAAGDGAPVDVIDWDRSADSWTRLLYIANLHYAAPLVHDAVTALDAMANMPEDVAGYLSSIRHANAERNDHIRDQIGHFVPALNEIGIEPILLKGTAFLYDDPGYGDARMMVDIDFLVPPDCERAAWDAMRAIGYTAGDDDDYARAHQMNAIHRPGAPAVVEIHRTPGPQRTLLTVESAFADSVPLELAAGRCRAMSPTHRVLHTLFHGQVQDFHYWFARPQFRTLADLRRLGSAAGRTVDWPEIERRFAAAGYQTIVDGTAALMTDWFGAAPLPPRPVTRRARRYVAHCDARLDHAERELGFWQRWIGWASVNLLPARLAYRHRLEGTGWGVRLPVLAYRQAAFVAKMATWPLRQWRRSRGS